MLSFYYYFVPFFLAAFAVRGSNVRAYYTTDELVFLPDLLCFAFLGFVAQV